MPRNPDKISNIISKSLAAESGDEPRNHYLQEYCCTRDVVYQVCERKCEGRQSGARASLLLGTYIDDLHIYGGCTVSATLVKTATTEKQTITNQYFVFCSANFRSESHILVPPLRSLTWMARSGRSVKTYLEIRYDDITLCARPIQFSILRDKGPTQGNHPPPPQPLPLNLDGLARVATTLHNKPPGTRTQCTDCPFQYKCHVNQTQIPCKQQLNNQTRRYSRYNTIDTKSQYRPTPSQI